MKKILSIVALTSLSACAVYPSGSVVPYSAPMYTYTAPAYRAPVYVVPRPYYAPTYRPYYAPRYNRSYNYR